MERGALLGLGRVSSRCSHGHCQRCREAVTVECVLEDEGANQDPREQGQAAEPAGDAQEARGANAGFAGGGLAVGVGGEPCGPVSMLARGWRDWLWGISLRGRAGRRRPGSADEVRRTGGRSGLSGCASACRGAPTDVFPVTPGAGSAAEGQP